jgi:hypothetical protein
MPHLTSSHMVPLTRNSPKSRQPRLTRSYSSRHALQLQESSLPVASSTKLQHAAGAAGSGKTTPGFKRSFGHLKHPRRPLIDCARVRVTPPRVLCHAVRPLCPHPYIGSYSIAAHRGCAGPVAYRILFWADARGDGRPCTKGVLETWLGIDDDSGNRI